MNGEGKEGKVEGGEWEKCAPLVKIMAGEYIIHVAEQVWNLNTH